MSTEQLKTIINEKLKDNNLDSILLAGFIEQDLKLCPDRKQTVSKILESNGKLIKVYVEGSIEDATEKLQIKITGLCKGI